MLPQIVEGGGLIDLSGVAPVIQKGWFLVTIPNLIWYLLMFALFAIGVFVQMPTKKVEDRSDDGGRS